jgi:hypothetical protein
MRREPPESLTSSRFRRLPSSLVLARSPALAACHAGGRGFESRRSRSLKIPALESLRRLDRRHLAAFGQQTGSTCLATATGNACKCGLFSHGGMRIAPTAPRQCPLRQRDLRRGSPQSGHRPSVGRQRCRYSDSACLARAAYWSSLIRFSARLGHSVSAGSRGLRSRR